MLELANIFKLFDVEKFIKIYKFLISVIKILTNKRLLGGIKVKNKIRSVRFFGNLLFYKLCRDFYSVNDKKKKKKERNSSSVQSNSII